MKTRKTKITPLSLYEIDRVNLEYITQVNKDYIKDTKKGNGMTGAVRFLIEMYLNNETVAPVQVEHNTVPASVVPDKPAEEAWIPPEVEVNDVEETYDDRFDGVDSNDTEEKADSTLDGILKRMIKEIPFVLRLKDYPRELIYGEAKIKRDVITKRLRQEISLEINKAKELRKYQEINDRIEAREALPSDFNPENGLKYSAIKNDIMTGRVQRIFPYATLAHHFNRMVAHNKQFHTEGYIGSVRDITDDPFERFQEEAEDIIKGMVIDFDPVVMFNDILDKTAYDKHMMKLGEIYKNED